MKVLHVSDDLAGMSGVRSYLQGLEEAMAPLGIHCELESLGSPHRRFGGVLSRWASWRYYSSMTERLQRSPRPDLVHAHNLWMRLSPTPLLAARKAGIPVVMTVHDYHLICPRKWMITRRDEPCSTGFGARCLVANCRGTPHGWPSLPYNDLRWLKVALHRLLLRRWVDVFIAPSEHLAGWLARNLSAENIVTIPNYSKTPIHTSGPARRERPTILYAGRLASEKGVEILMAAMGTVLQTVPEATLLVAGDGPERPALERLARETLPAGSCRFTGPLAAGELDRLYAESSLVVLPTLWMENCPVTVLEAMAHGRPVVATRIGGLPELVEDGVDGFLFDRGDSTGLAHRILRLLTDPERLRAAGRAATARHGMSSTPGAHARRLARVYASVSRPRGTE